MPDADLIFRLIIQVLVPGVLVAGALVGALFSMLFVYVSLLDILDAPNKAPGLRK